MTTKTEALEELKETMSGCASGISECIDKVWWEFDCDVNHIDVDGDLQWDLKEIRQSLDRLDTYIKQFKNLRESR